MFRTQKSRSCGVQNTTKTLCFGVFRTLLPDVQNICKFFNAMFWTPQNTGLGGVLNISSKITPKLGVQNTPQKWRKCSEHSENVVNTGWTLPPKTGEMFRTPTPLCSEHFHSYPAASCTCQRKSLGIPIGIVWSKNWKELQFAKIVWRKWYRRTKSMNIIAQSGYSKIK